MAWRAARDGPLRARRTVRQTALFSHRPIEDTVSSLICHGALWRFPGLRILLVENGGSWVPSFLDHMDHVYSRSPQEYEMKPSDTFNRNIWVQVNHEEDPRADRQDRRRPSALRVGLSHVEGLADPLSYLEGITQLRTTRTSARSWVAT
jgi:hypothetical protein